VSILLQNLMSMNISNVNLRAWLSSSTVCTQQQQTEQLIQLTPSAVTPELLTSVQRFLQRYANEFVPRAHATWRPIRLNYEHTAKLLKYQLMTTNSLVTYSARSTVGLNEIDEGVPEKSYENAEISSLSMQHLFLLKTRRYGGNVIGHTFIYCDTMDELTNHIRAQLRHLANVAGTRDVAYVLDFPVKFDADVLLKLFAESGSSWPAGMSTATRVGKAYLASTSIIRAQL